MHPALRDGSEKHAAGSSGVTTSQTLQSSTELLSIPSHMWLTLDRFPRLRDVNLHKFSACTDEDVVGRQQHLKFAAVIALETLKGESSFFAPLLRHYPELTNYNQYYPRYMDEHVAADFQGLPLVSVVRGLQAVDAKLKKCFKQWKAARLSAVSAVDWHDMLAALAHFRTRQYATGDNIGALVPLMDLLEGESSLNTQYSVSGANQKSSLYRLVTDSTVKQGSKVYGSYCPSCDNEHLMAFWGLYFENNPNQLKRESSLSRPHADCSNAGRPHPVAHSLKDAALAMLDVDAYKAEGNLTAPRCRQDMVNSAQPSPLRCNIARLAWEYCAADWGLLQQKALSMILTDQKSLERDSSSIISLAEVTQSYDLSARHNTRHFAFATSTRGHSLTGRTLASAPLKEKQHHHHKLDIGLARQHHHHRFLIGEHGAIKEKAEHATRASMRREQ